MKLIVGLGNPGSKYKKTRHNLGFMVVDLLAGDEKWRESKKANCLYVKKQMADQEVELVKPLTYMNNSGQTVSHIQKKHRLNSQDIIIVHDDIDLALGEIKIQEGRGAAGHKGVQSIIEQLGNQDFIRVRIGIRPAELSMDTEKFVLQKFTPEETKIIQETITKAVPMIETAL
jgi:PTH1 family peptidyl-tRNA hydrolase